MIWYDITFKTSEIALQALAELLTAAFSSKYAATGKTKDADYIVEMLTVAECFLNSKILQMEDEDLRKRMKNAIYPKPHQQHLKQCKNT